MCAHAREWEGANARTWVTCQCDAPLSRSAQAHTGRETVSRSSTVIGHLDRPDEMQSTTGHLTVHGEDVHIMVDPIVRHDVGPLVVGVAVHIDTCADRETARGSESGVSNGVVIDEGRVSVSGRVSRAVTAAVVHFRHDVEYPVVRQSDVAIAWRVRASPTPALREATARATCSPGERRAGCCKMILEHRVIAITLAWRVLATVTCSLRLRRCCVRS